MSLQDHDRFGKLNIEHCCHWEKPCVPPPHPHPPAPSLGPSVEPPCRVESSWERNALGCRAAATVEDRRNNSHSMDSNDPYLHLSKYASRVESIYSLLCSPRSFCILFACFMAFLCSLRALRRAVSQTLTNRFPARESDCYTSLLANNLFATGPN